jgi:hypothetical protein
MGGREEERDSEGPLKAHEHFAVAAYRRPRHVSEKRH